MEKQGKPMKTGGKQRKSEENEGKPMENQWKTQGEANQNEKQETITKQKKMSPFIIPIFYPSCLLRLPRSPSSHLPSLELPPSEAGQVM